MTVMGGNPDFPDENDDLKQAVPQQDEAGREPRPTPDREPKEDPVPVTEPDEDDDDDDDNGEPLPPDDEPNTQTDQPAA